jgi:hypothetical protein
MTKWLNFKTFKIYKFGIQLKFKIENLKLKTR